VGCRAEAEKRVVANPMGCFVDLRRRMDMDGVGAETSTPVKLTHYRAVRTVVRNGSTQ